MLRQKSRIIVLHTLRHADNGAIVEAYSDRAGRATFYGYVGGKSKLLNRLTALNILDIEVLSTPNKGMPIIKEANEVYGLLSLRGDVQKSCISLFICELLSKSIREIEPNTPLFEFLVSSIRLLNSMTEGFANFHLHFLANFCKIMGYMPKDNFNFDTPYFDFVQGEYVSLYKEDVCFRRGQSQLLHNFLVTPSVELGDIQLPGEERRVFLEKMLQYLSFHLGCRLNLKSLEVLREIFNF